MERCVEDSPRDMGFARSYLFIALVVCVLAFAHAAHSGSLLKVEDAHVAPTHNNRGGNAISVSNNDAEITGVQLHGSYQGGHRTIGGNES